MVFRRHFREPSLGFMYKADMWRILFGGKERDHAKRRLAVMGAEACTAIDECGNAQCFEGSHGSSFSDSLAARLDGVRHTELLPEIDVAQGVLLRHLGIGDTRPVPALRVLEVVERH